MLLWALAAGMAAFGLLIALTAPFVATSIAIFGLVGVAVMLIYGTNLLSYHELMVAGEVLVSAPSRARRVISDQIMAMDVTAKIQNAQTHSEISERTGIPLGTIKSRLRLGLKKLHDALIAAGVESDDHATN